MNRKIALNRGWVGGGVTILIYSKLVGMCKFTSSILRRIFCVSTCCVNVTWPCSLVPFIRFLSLSLSFSLLSLTPHSNPHTDTTPCWGSKWSKITHSATQSLLCLALGSDCFIPWLFLSLSLLLFCFLLFFSSEFLFFFSYQRNSDTTRGGNSELRDLSHCALVLCCVVCVDSAQPHTSTEVCKCGHLCLVGIGGVALIYFRAPCAGICLR